MALIPHNPVTAFTCLINITVEAVFERLNVKVLRESRVQRPHDLTHDRGGAHRPRLHHHTAIHQRRIWCRHHLRLIVFCTRNEQVKLYAELEELEELDSNIIQLEEINNEYRLEK